MFFIPKRLDLVGRTYGNLVVTEMLWNYQNTKRTYCRCVGEGQQECIVRADALQSGATRTISGSRTKGQFKDLTGMRFGRLTVIQLTQQRAANGSVIWECLCDCGNIVYQSGTNLQRGHTTSCGCAKMEYIDSTKIDIIGKRFGKLVVIEEVFPQNRKRRMVKCLCDCGNIHICSISDLTTGHTTSCGCDKRSRGERFIQELLDELHIPYIPQKRFSDCKNIKPLPFDFYLYTKNTCIEYDGAQHFHPVPHFGGDEMFAVRQQNDRIKDVYCKENDIRLIRLSYKMKKEEMYKIISDLISPATITA